MAIIEDEIMDVDASEDVRGSRNEDGARSDRVCGLGHSGRVDGIGHNKAPGPQYTFWIAGSHPFDYLGVYIHANEL
ncbi:hypothetical protein Sjap_001838 [Stephania japonica]|uniref:Uncharacterized protein n=1 Tax=Stephania japonica TaxID=461633 RepID=A0AAP0PRW8_9MAGN